MAGKTNYVGGKYGGETALHRTSPLRCKLYQRETLEAICCLTRG
jgi:hypothetical protein